MFRGQGRRHKWNAKILELAMTITHDHYFGARAGVGEREIKSKLLEVSQNRNLDFGFFSVSVVLGVAHGIPLVPHGNEQRGQGFRGLGV